MERIWAGALDILNDGDPDWKQMLPRDLEAGEYGRQHILSVMSMKSGIGGSATFVGLAQPFLLVITHPAMLDCLTVDTFVGGLYNFISGTHGKRAIDFFQNLCTNLTDAYCKSNISRSSAESILLAMMTALHEILKREQRAAFNDGDLLDLIDSADKTAKVVNSDKSSVFAHSINQRNVAIRTIIARAKGLLVGIDLSPVGGVSTTVVKSTFPREVIIPGGKHDNDDADISQIKILPTDDEIRSDKSGFLPTTDLSHPHFLKDSVQRHLDTQFRLLRHDIFGELKAALGGLIHAFAENPRLLDNTKLNVGDMRAYTYPKAHISYLSFHEKRGIQASVSFN